MLPPAEVYKKIERSTLGQYRNPLWHEIKSTRISSTQVGKIVKRRKPVSKRFVSNMYTKFDIGRLPAVKHGIFFETFARKLYCEKTKNMVREVGLFKSRTHDYIVASPDGLFFNPTTRTEGILEIKCPFSARNCTVEEALKKLRYIDKTGKLKRTHDYFFQIQCQMFCSEIHVANFVIYTFKGIHIETIHYDANFWHSTVLPKIEDFYRKWQWSFDCATLRDPLSA